MADGTRPSAELRAIEERVQALQEQVRSLAAAVERLRTDMTAMHLDLKTCFSNEVRVIGERVTRVEENSKFTTGVSVILATIASAIGAGINYLLLRR